MKIPLIILLLIPSFVFSQVHLESESDQQISIKTAEYTAIVKKSPFGIELQRNGITISSTSDSAFIFDINHNTLLVRRLVSSKMIGNSFFAELETSQPGVFASLVLSVENQKLDLKIKLPEYILPDQMSVSFQLKPGKHWFGGPVVSGHNWPLETGDLTFDPMLAHSNQATPFWISASGVGYFMPTYENMGYHMNNNANGKFELNVKKTNVLGLELFIGKDIREAHLLFARSAGLPRTVPPRAFFDQAQFNTWIEFMTNVNQAGVIDYAKKIRTNEFPCEVLMIDAGWEIYNGDFSFNPAKFADPKAMTDELHRMGFKVILWTSPYIERKSKYFDFLDKNKFLIMDASGNKPGVIKWWGGEDHQVDLSNPYAFEWFLGKIRKLQEDYGIDGFKQDGGDAKYVPVEYKTFAGASPNLSTDYWAKLGKYTEYNEYRVSWLMQEAGLVQRLRDKYNGWTRDKGLGSLIPHGLTNSMIGYPYFCPDMIGGGEAKGFRDPNFKGMGTELFIRWTQASALMPMMQFSYAPWNLDEEAVAICRKYAQLHNQLGDYIFDLAVNASRTGEPIARPLFYEFPADQQTYLISDQFMLGSTILVAPVLEQGAVTRDIYLPPGTWKNFWSGEIFQGGETIKEFPAPIEVLPLFIKLSSHSAN